MRSPPHDPKATAARIKAERERLGLTQQQVADALEITQQSYAYMERHANPTERMLMRLQEVGYEIENVVPGIFKARA